MKPTLFYLFAGLLNTALLSCQAQQTQPSSFTDTDGVLIVSVYSRGAYQYILAVPDADAKTRFYPVNLADSLKQAALKTDPATPLQVRFSGRLTGKNEVIKRITANDAGEAAGEIPQVTLSAISVRK
ncbi:hypothetical protein [Fibrella forsythiae]|uniref:Lipoprotein n=1 Tax=Fibrella forsythiae TaxID=2817061 RepID=A0ABS3JG23_9BACT|nr:hypothetical protein [Fibrella forsythiae]MBO0948937.1 hypothetical protein [Fibrella forsythiae]